VQTFSKGHILLAAHKPTSRILVTSFHFLNFSEFISYEKNMKAYNQKICNFCCLLNQNILRFKMDYPLIIGIISFVSAGLITFFTIKKDRFDKNEADQKDQAYRADLQAARDTIVQQQKAAEEQSAIFYKESALQTEKLNNQQSRLIEKQGLVIQLQKENQEKAEKLIELQNQTINQITGGDSYCYLMADWGIKGESPNFSLKHQGKYPLQNIRLKIEDIGKKEYLVNAHNSGTLENPLLGYDDLEKRTTYNLEKHSLYRLTDIDIPEITVEKDQKNLLLQVWIYLDNAFYFETLESKNYRDIKSQLKIVLTDGDGKPVIDKIFRNAPIIEDKK